MRKNKNTETEDQVIIQNTRLSFYDNTLRVESMNFMKAISCWIDEWWEKQKQKDIKGLWFQCSTFTQWQNNPLEIQDSYQH